MVGFADQSASKGAARSAKHLRYTAYGVNLEGVRTIEGGGIVWEGIVHIRNADGTTEPVGTTDGQITPQEFTLTVGAATHRILEPLVSESPQGTKPRGDVVVQYVAAKATDTAFAVVYGECTVSGIVPNTPDDGSELTFAYSFMPTTADLNA